MEATQETSLFLEKILEELDRKQGTVDYQELCASLCARLDLAQLARLRGALLYTACLDPGFPASLFKDREACAGGPRATKLAVAADIVAIFHLAQAGGAAGGGQQGSQKGAAEPGERPLGRGLPARRPAARQKADRPECVPASEPGFSLGVRKEAKHRAASLDRLPAGAPFPGAGPPPCEMQRTRFPMHLDGESVSDRDSPPVGPALRDAFLPHDEGPFLGPPRGPERSAFQGDFPLLVAASPAAGRPGRGAEPPRRKEPPRAPFFNHSFEMPGPGPYLSPGYSPGPGRRRAKHESLEDLQASTYFGPTAPAPGARDARRGPGRPSRQTPWPAKSWSLTAEDGPGFEGAEATPPFPGSGSQTPGLSAPEGRPAFLGPEEPQRILPAGYRAAVKPGGPGAKEKPTAPDPGPREAGPKFQDKSAGGAGRQLSSDTSSVGTQTEQPAPRPPRRPDPGEPLARKPSDDSSEGVSDDISDIFRFLDDSGLVQSSCYNSTGSLSQLHRSDGDSSPERPRAQVADGAPGGRGEEGRGPDRARPSEEELKTSVCQLVLRIGEIERKLESLSGVREEISQVLGKLNKLDQKMQRPDVLSVQVDLNSLASEVPSEDGTSPGAFRARRGARGPPPDGDDWCCSEASGGHGESLRVRALKKSLGPRPPSRSLTEEDSATESKMPSSANSPRDWRTLTRPGRPGQPPANAGPGEDEKADRQYDLPPQHRPPKQPKAGFLVEQVFSPHPYPASLKAHAKSTPLYTDMRRTELAEVARGPGSWALEEYARNAGDKGKLAALDLQTQESLNPNNLEYWMEDIYTPGYDSLLKRKEAEFRRAKVCKMVALIGAAACTVLLVIVVPLCTMKS